MLNKIVIDYSLYCAMYMYKPQLLYYDGSNIIIKVEKLVEYS